LVLESVQTVLVVLVDGVEDADVAVGGECACFLEAFAGGQEPDDLSASAFDGGRSVLVMVLEFGGGVLELEFRFGSTHALV
jgi:hypothetical protein